MTYLGNSEENFSNLIEKDSNAPSLRKRTLSILNVFEQTLCTQEWVELEGKPEDELSEITEQEEVDIGDIAFDIAIEAVDDITKIKERLGNKIDKFNKEKNKIITKVTTFDIRRILFRQRQESITKLIRRRR